MEKQVVGLRKAYPDTLLLFECGYRMRIFGKDAEVSTVISDTNLMVQINNAAAVLDIRAQQHKNFLEASVPVHRTLFHARRLVHAGFKVGVVKQVDSVATRAANKAPGAQRKPLERCVTEIYTRATIPEVEDNGDDSDEEDTRARFIACVVEETIHSKPFFSQSMHEVDEDTKRTQTTKRGVGSLLSILNHTKTNGGARKLRDWIHSPLVDIQEIMARQKTIERLAFPPGSLSTESLPHRLAYEELTTAILPRSKHLLKYLQQVHLGKATPSQAVGALQILQDLEGHINGLKAMFSSATIEDQSTLEKLLEGYPALQARLTPLLDEVDVKRARQNDVENTIQRLLCRHPSQARKYRELTRELETLAREYDAVLVTCRSILKDPLLEFTTFRGGSLSDIHHLIEVKRTDLHEVPQTWLVVNSTKKIVRFHPRQIIQLHVQEEFVKEQKEQLVRALWRRFVNQVDAQVYVTGMACVDILANLDALCSLATVAQSYPNYTKPQFVDGNSILEIIDGRHPIIEMLLDGSSYISNSVLLSSSLESLMVVSGPNMGGKTSLLRMCALVVILAQIGSFVPASSVRLSVFDGVYTLMHRSTINCGSSCSSELTALGTISRNATKRSLVLIDEIGFGMAAQYAEAVAVAQMMYLSKTVGCLVVFATHLTAAIHKLQALLGDKCQTKQLEYHFYEQDEADANVEVEDVVTFHYVLKDGVASDSVAIETARRAGIASAILERAKELQGDL
ncbi:Tartrate-resistant acid phosphatase type 5 [Phytophthora nicotianae]|uniref:Tartrate-resistant acid phosphatase type 5 n=1 Tax=Phytophthora nicotianae TaxID=4792 RepID=A0A0W8DIG2_PHYNI|nr:Tartrate-resistant acid phosphatase type 5 [Phytophthora nicotianae]